MKLFEYKDFKLKIADEALTLKAFKDLHDRDKSKGKEIAFKELAFIYEGLYYKKNVLKKVLSEQEKDTFDRVEKEIYYQKMLLSIDKTKESILPSKTATLLGNVYQKVFSGTFGTLLKMLIPYGINWYLNRKRGD